MLSREVRIRKAFATFSQLPADGRAYITPLMRVCKVDNY